MSFKQVIQLRFYNEQKSIPNRPPRINCSLFGKNNQHRDVQLVGIPTEEALIIAIIFLQPRSRGSIKVQNNDPLNRHKVKTI